MLQGLADKAEAAVEAKAEADKRTGAGSPLVTYRGQAMPMGQAIETAFGGIDPAIAALNQTDRTAAQPSAETRKKIAELLGGQKKAQP